jgi:MFS family permease
MHEGSVRDANTRPNQVYAWYVVGVLTLAVTVSFIDRQLITLLFAPIKHDLHLSDTEVSLIAGFAFALFYALLGVPIATLSDRYNRSLIIAAGMFLWSLMTSLCGLARTFWQFFLARVGVGIGETVLSPSAFSLIADYFPPDRLGKALGLYNLAIYSGSGVALLLGSGVVKFVMHAPPVSFPGIGEIRPWQFALVLVGTPGALLAAILFTVREPRQRRTGGQARLDRSRQSLASYLISRRQVYVPHFAAFSILGLLGTGIATWVPEFFLRKYGWSTDKTAMLFGSILAVCGGPAVLLGGWYADRRRSVGELDAPIRVAIGAIIPLGLCAALMPNMARPEFAMVLLAGMIFSFGLFGALAPASIQMITPAGLRARVSAVFLFCTTLAGMGLGPTVVALLTDYVFGREQLLYKSLTALSLVTAPAGFALMIATLGPFRAAASAALEEDTRVLVSTHAPV